MSNNHAARLSPPMTQLLLLLLLLAFAGALTTAAADAAATVPAPTTTTTTTTTMTSPECRWDSEAGSCDLSSAAFLAAFVPGGAGAADNGFLLMVLRAHAREALCNARAGEAACSADGACVYSADMVRGLCGGCCLG